MRPLNFNPIPAQSVKHISSGQLSPRPSINHICFDNNKMRDVSSTETYSLSGLSAVCLVILFNAWKSDGEPLFASLAMGGLAFSFSYVVIMWTGDVFMRRGYKGRDMSKKNPTEMYVIPEQ